VKLQVAAEKAHDSALPAHVANGDPAIRIALRAAWGRRVSAHRGVRTWTARIRCPVPLSPPACPAAWSRATTPRRRGAIAPRDWRRPAPAAAGMSGVSMCRSPRATRPPPPPQTSCPWLWQSRFQCAQAFWHWPAARHRGPGSRGRRRIIGIVTP